MSIVKGNGQEATELFPLVKLAEEQGGVPVHINQDQVPALETLSMIRV